MRIFQGLAFATVLMISAPVSAGGDFYASGPSRYCHFVENADELVSYTDLRALKAEVHSRYEHAAEVANSNQAIYSQSPLHEWASQAKVSCAKSYGYLRRKRKWRKRPDHVMLQKCECFYQRMTAYLGR